MGSRHNLAMARYKRATPYKPKTKKQRSLQQRIKEGAKQRAPVYDDANDMLNADDWGWYFKMREDAE